MKIIVIGDVHGDFRIVDLIQDSTDANFYLQVGDLGSTMDRYPDVEKPLIFIPGNHENADQLSKYPHDDGKVLIKHNLWYLPIGEYTTFRGISIAGFGGNYAPNYFFKRRNQLEGRHRLHYTHEDYLKMLDCVGRMDILLTHEAPSPFMISNLTRKTTTDRGRKLITKLIYILRPSYHFFGHHHVASTGIVSGTISKCIPNNTYWEIEV